MQVTEILAESLQVGDRFVINGRVEQVTYIAWGEFFNDNRATFRLLVRDCQHGEQAEVHFRRIKKNKLVLRLRNAAPNEMAREQFMEFFRNNEQTDSLSNDDRAEIFLGILPDRSDLTKELLSQLANCYGTCYPFDHGNE